MASADSQGSSAVLDGGPALSAVPEHRRKIKRRNFFVKKWLQTRYIVYSLLIMLASSVALFVLLFRYARLVIRTEMSQGHSVVFHTWDILRPEMVRASLSVVAIVVLLAVAATVALSWTVSRASKRVMANIEGYRSGSGTAGWTPVRHPSEFQHFQNTLTSALDGYGTRLGRLRGEVADLEKMSREVREAGGAVDDEGVAKLRIGIAGLREGMNIFGREAQNGQAG